MNSGITLLKKVKETKNEKKVPDFHVYVNGIRVNLP